MKDFELSDVEKEDLITDEWLLNIGFKSYPNPNNTPSMCFKLDNFVLISGFNENSYFIRGLNCKVYHKSSLMSIICLKPSN